MQQNKLKKIALLTDGIYPYAIGGMQRHSYYLTKYLAQNNIQVDLYHTQKNKEYDINKLEFFTEEEKKSIRSFVVEFPEDGNLPGHYIRNSFEYSTKIYEILKKNLDVDFIYIKGFAGWKLIKEKQKGLKFPRIGIKFHGLEMFQKAPSFKDSIAQYFFYYPTLFNLRNADYVFSYGGKITTLLTNKKIKQSKIIEIPTGISSEWLKKKEEGKKNNKIKFIFIGRYERRKGIEELNKAIKRIMGKTNFEFYFIGPIPENKKIKNGVVTYLGAITQPDELKKTLQQSDVLVCPSHSEGMPNVILEGMASGLAIIASDVGAINEMVSSQNGWLIHPGKTSEIEKAMLAAINCDRNQLEDKKSQSKAVVEKKFLWNNIIQKTISEIEKII